ncbi:TonB-dependent receptor plug domain-containing protein [Myxococcota bacterium]
MAPNPEPTTDAVAPGNPPPPALGPEPIVEVVVEGERRRRDGSSLSRRETRQIPGAFGDPFRAVEAMPGVSSVVSGMPYFYVRGAPPGNVGYFLDGIRVPMLYHAFAGPSVLHPAFVERVELHRGGYSARLGRYAGGIVAAQTAAPSPQWRGEASVRAIDAGAMVQAPFAHDRGFARVGGRYSYAGLVLSLLSPLTLEYWDYQSLLSYELGPDDTLRLLTFGALDYAASDEGTSLAGVEFHRVDLRHVHRMDRVTELRTAMTFGVDRTRQETGDLSEQVGGSDLLSTRGTAGGFLRDTLWLGRASLTRQLPNHQEFEAGLDVAVDQIQLRMNKDSPLYAEFKEFFPSRDDWALGVWTELGLRPAPHVRVAPGLRIDGYHSLDTSAVAVEPRVVANYDLSRRVRLLHSLGITHQPPAFAPPGVPGVQQVAGVRDGLQTSYQVSSGVEVELPAEWVASVTAFDNVFLNLSDPVGVSGEYDFETGGIRSLGAAWGVEIGLRRPLTRRVSGFANYTLSRTTRSHGPLKSVAAFDRTHVANAVLVCDLGARWRVGARLFYQSGVPVREPTPAGPRYPGSDRAPGFFRVDLRTEKRWRLGTRGYLAAVAEVLNATAGREVLRRNCNASGCEDASFGPLILPSLGIEAAFQ